MRRVNLASLYQLYDSTAVSSDCFSGSDAVLVAAGLIVAIVQAISCSESYGRYQDLNLHLQSLHRSLVLTTDAIQRYKDTPLYQSLVNTIDPVVQRCLLILRKLYCEIDYYRQALFPTANRTLWCLVSWAGWNVDTYSRLREELLVRLVYFSGGTSCH
jgi:hypothetical protein